MPDLLVENQHSWNFHEWQHWLNYNVIDPLFIYHFKNLLTNFLNINYIFYPAMSIISVSQESVILPSWNPYITNKLLAALETWREAHGITLCQECCLAMAKKKIKKHRQIILPWVFKANTLSSTLHAMWNYNEGRVVMNLGMVENTTASYGVFKVQTKNTASVWILSLFALTRDLSCKVAYKEFSNKVD